VARPAGAALTGAVKMTGWFRRRQFNGAQTDVIGFDSGTG